MKADAAAIVLYGNANYETPKSVFAMLAYHMARRIVGDNADRDEVMKVLADEWDALHANGLIKQKPRQFETLAKEDARLDGIARQLEERGLKNAADAVAQRRAYRAALTA